MSQALWLLLGMQMRGWVRYLGRGVKTVRGVLLLLVGLGVFIPWLFAVFIGASEGRMEPATVSRFGPAFLLAYCFVNVIFSPSERAVYFTPAEVQFLFAGPFTRREVLVYKIILTLLVSLPVALIMGAIFRIRDGWVPAILIGLLLMATFMQLLTMALGLLASTVGAGLYSRGRKIAGVVLALLVGVVILEAGRRSGWQWRQLATQFVDTAAWQTLSFPLRAFFDVLIADRLWPTLVVPALIALAVNAALVGLILLLDHGYQEASAASSARRYAAFQRMRGRSVGAEGPGATRKVRFSIPSLPYWGGIGPVLWRQLTGAYRALGRLMLALVLLGTFLAFWLTGSVIAESEAFLPVMLLGLVVWLSVFITTLVPFDYRGDLDRIALLKSLPIVPWRLTVGQLLTPVLLLTLTQWIALTALAPLAPDFLSATFACAAVVPLFNFVLIALDNLLFLIFPVRLMAATPGDFQALGRNVLLSMSKLIGLMVVGSLALIASGIVGLLTESVALSVLATGPVLLVSGVGLVPLVSLAFQRFDVGRDTPA